jgi:hypothetical protein
MTWHKYHEATKRHVESLRRKRHILDRANMPHPFRHYEGVPVIDLPADPPASGMAALDVLQGTLGSTSAGDGPAAADRDPQNAGKHAEDRVCIHADIDATAETVAGRSYGTASR